MISKTFTGIFFILFSCSSSYNWNGGPITKIGNYEYKGYKLCIKSSDGLINYHMLNSNGDTVLIGDREFSDFHRWAFAFDQNLNLWVLSSDMGHLKWQKDLGSGKYRKHEFHSPIPKDSIPKDIYKTLSQFPFSIKEK